MSSITNNSHAQQFGKRFNLARKRLNLTQHDVGLAVQVTSAAVSAWDRGLSIPQASHRPDLASVLKVSLGWLYEGVGDFQPLDDISNNKMVYKAASVPVLESFQIKQFLRSKQHLIRKGVANMSAEELKEGQSKVLMKDESMCSAFDIPRSIIVGEILLCDFFMKDGVRTGDIVLVDDSEDADWHFPRLYAKDGADEILIALNSAYKKLTVSDKVKIVAKVISTERSK